MATQKKTSVVFTRKLKKKLQAQQLKKVQGPSQFPESVTWEEICGELHKFNVSLTLPNPDMANCRYVV